MMVRNKDQIIEPDNDRLLFIGSKVKMDMFPMAVQWVLFRCRTPCYQLVKQLIIVHKYLQVPGTTCIRTCVEGERRRIAQFDGAP
jgi:hypothetical protein